MIRIIAPALLVLAVSTIDAQQPREVTAADYARAERFLGVNTAPLITGTGVRPTWLDDGRFWYRTTVPNGSAFFLVDPARRTRVSAFDQTRLAAALAAASGGTVDGSRLPFQTFELAKDGRSMMVTVQGRRWNCDLQLYTCAPEASALEPENSSVSPDGRLAVFIRDNNLWLRTLAAGTETQLTTDGIENFGYATDNAGWIRSDQPVVTWSPDSKQLATFQHDGRGVSDMHLVATTVGAPRLDSWKYPLPGDSVIFRISRVVISQLDQPRPRLVRLQMPPDQHRSTISDHVACESNRICDTQWYPDGSHVAFISSSRDHKTAWMRVANAQTGAVRTLFEERMPTGVGNVGQAENLWRVLPASNELIWWSERDNWMHLYLYDLRAGTLKNRITSGEGNVNDIVHIDERTRTIYFAGSGKEQGRDPYFQHLYRIGFDGRGQTLLTPENANHVVSVSHDGRFIVDTYSSVSAPVVSVLRDRNGQIIQELLRADISRLSATGWKPPTPIKVKGRDGTTDLYGLMFTPTTLDSTRKYPVVNYIYPAPSGTVGVRSFSPARRDNQALAELGFIVVEIDGMGTMGRSRSFADVQYGRMADNTLPDQIAGLKDLARRYRFIDIDRVGVWGHSGGGFAAAAAMFRHADFYDVGISESGNHDQRNYEDDWGERYQGLLERTGNTDNYASEATQTYAANLRGKLLLAHGAMDDNVPPYTTMLVVDALVKAGKDFDLIIFPHARHGYGVDGNYMMRRRWDYFVRHLLGAEPPREYRIGGPRP